MVCRVPGKLVDAVACFLGEDWDAANVEVDGLQCGYAEILEESASRFSVSLSRCFFETVLGSSLTLLWVPVRLAATRVRSVRLAPLGGVKGG